MRFPLFLALAAMAAGSRHDDPIVIERELSPGSAPLTFRRDGSHRRRPAYRPPGTSARRAWKRRVRGGHVRNRPRR